MKRLIAVAVLVLAAGPALATPTITVAPADGARFLVAQRFDLRVEGKGTGPYSATLEIDGMPVPFTSGAQGSVATDGITLAGFGGFNVRGFSSSTPGTHVVKATFTDATGTATSTTRFAVVDPFARRGGLGRPLRNVIILLGDGMGVAHRTAARIVRYGVKGGDPQGWLAMDRFPGSGLVTTHSLNTIVTDSAPGMACYASGNHANNNQEGVFPAPGIANPFYAPRVEYMSEYLHRVKGTSLGLVTTADVEDATPAANAVHTTNRNAGQGICDEYLDESDAAGTGTHGTGLAVLMGGGRRWFLPSAEFGSSRSSSNDYAGLPADLLAGWGLPASAAGKVDPARNLLAEFQGAGFTYADTKTALDRAMAGNPSKLLGLFGYGNMNVALDKLAKRRGVKLEGAATYAVDDYHAPDQPMLDEMAEAALKVLGKNRNGFVLMIEGAHIDKQSHAMDAERVIGEMIEFDRAVEVARRFADDEGDTLVLVLADHECAGFSLIGALTGTVDEARSAPSDAAKLDPLVQPERQKKVGVFDAAGFPRYTILDDGYPASYDVNGKLLVGYGASGDRYETWLTKPLPIVDSLLPNGIRGELSAAGYPADPVLRSERATGFFLRGQAVGRTQAVHTAADIPLSAYSSKGSKAWEQFAGVQTNTDVFFKVMRSVLSEE